MISTLNPRNPDKTSPTTQNCKSSQNTYSLTHDIPLTYECQTSYTVEIKFINDRYVTPVTIELGSSDSDNYVNLHVNHHKPFAALKLLDPSISITINDTTINHPGVFSIKTTHTETFEVITDRKPKFLHLFCSP